MPLEPPVLMIALNDPFIEFFGQTKTLTRDLFFSGHTSILFLCYLTAESKRIKNYFLLATISIAVLLLIQHVHYSADILIAFFVSYVSYTIAKRIVV